MSNSFRFGFNFEKLFPCVAGRRCRRCCCGCCYLFFIECNDNKFLSTQHPATKRPKLISYNKDANEEKKVEKSSKIIKWNFLNSFGDSCELCQHVMYRFSFVCVMLSIFCVCYQMIRGKNAVNMNWTTLRWWRNIRSFQVSSMHRNRISTITDH